MIEPLKKRNFRLLFGGQTISYLGDTFYAVALPWVVFMSNGGVQELSIVLTIYGTARIGTLLIGGVLSDRLGPRMLMLLTDIMRTGIVGLLAVLLLWEHLTLWQLCLFTALLGAFQGLFEPASLTIMPTVLPDDQLQAGNVLNAASLQLAGLFGSDLAGVLVSVVQSGIALFVDAFSFLVSAATLAAIRSPVQTRQQDTTVQQQNATVQKQEDDTSFRQQTFQQFVYHSRMFQVVLVVVVMSNLSVSFMEVALPSLAHNILRVGPNGYGFMLGAFGAGVIVGGLSTGILSNNSKRGVIGLLLLIIESAFISVIPFAEGLLVLCSAYYALE